jgi:hypothetical protein
VSWSLAGVLIGISMTSPALALIFFAATTSVSVDASDSLVIAACIEAADADAEFWSRSRTPSLAYVLPKGETSKQHLSDAQLSSDLRGTDLERLSGPIAHMRSRLGKGWSPNGLEFSSAMTIKISDPPRGPSGYWEEIHYQLWPPGYDSAGTTALVRGRVGPSAHSGTATCLLRLERDRWIAISVWVRWYA